jgi:hypothetical protein
MKMASSAALPSRFSLRTVPISGAVLRLACRCSDPEMCHASFRPMVSAGVLSVQDPENSGLRKQAGIQSYHRDSCLKTARPLGIRPDKLALGRRTLTTCGLITDPEASPMTSATRDDSHKG